MTLSWEALVGVGYGAAMVGFKVTMRLRLRVTVWSWLAMAAACPLARAAEHVTLKNGFELDCVRREVVGDRVRLYLCRGTWLPRRIRIILRLLRMRWFGWRRLRIRREPVVAAKIGEPVIG